MTEEIYPITTPEPGAFSVMARISGSGYASGWSQRGVYSAYSEAIGIGGKKVRLLSGSVSGGICCAAAYRGYHSEASENRAEGYVVLYDPTGAEIARIGLPLLSPITIDNVDVVRVYVAVGWTSASLDASRGWSANAGVIFKVLG